MEIPAYASPSLCIGRTFDVNRYRVGSDIFPSYVSTKTKDISKYTLKYKVVKTSNDVKELLDISSELALSIKADRLRAVGTGQYIKESRTLEGITEILAVIKCYTVNETMDESLELNEDTSKPLLGEMGTHFVRSVTYGAEIVASFKFKGSRREAIKGEAEGQLNFQGNGTALKNQLEKLLADLNDLPDISIKYYDTTLTENLSTSMQDLKSFIEEFPSRLSSTKNGQGIPIQFELQPLRDIVSRKNAKNVLEEIESRLDDLLNCKALVEEYVDAFDLDDLDDDVSSFSSQINDVLRKFRSAVCALSTGDEERQITACLKAYKKALDGSDEKIGKFFRHWKNMPRTSKLQTFSTSYKLPEGKHLTVVLFGKTGNGKSATGNMILGRNVFEVGGSATSVTAQCQYGIRKDEREIDVIDTPGVLDNSTISRMGSFQGHLPGYADHQKNILKEVSKIFAMAPFGFDAIIIVVKYGGRFSMEDAQALKILQSMLEEDAMDHMILVLTHGDQAEYEAEEVNLPVDQRVSQWIKTLPEWVQSFIQKIRNRVVLVNNTVTPHKNGEAYRKQLIKLIKVIDEMAKGKSPFVNRLTRASKEVVDKRITESLETSGLLQEVKSLEIEKEDLKRRMESIDRRREGTIEELEEELLDNERKTKALQEKKNAVVMRSVQAQAKMSKEGDGGEVTEMIQQMRPITSSILGGCFPASATFVEKGGLRRRMDSLKIGEEVQVFTETGLQFEPVITFIHRQPDVIQQFLKITTTKGKILKITEDHLIFVEKRGQMSTIPARDLKTGDMFHVREGENAKRDDARNISLVIEKGIYAPVTLSGTILVDDVHTSCYFDVLSHEWSHRAMGIARAVYYLSPWMLQWISGVGQKDGFPGWCRLAHKILTSLD